MFSVIILVFRAQGVNNVRFVRDIFLRADMYCIKNNAQKLIAMLRKIVAVYVYR